MCSSCPDRSVGNVHLCVPMWSLPPFSIFHFPSSNFHLALPPYVFLLSRPKRRECPPMCSYVVFASIFHFPFSIFQLPFSPASLCVPPVPTEASGMSTYVFLCGLCLHLPSSIFHLPTSI